jgi:hypothetical protein
MWTTRRTSIDDIDNGPESYYTLRIQLSRQMVGNRARRYPGGNTPKTLTPGAESKIYLLQIFS